MSEARSPGSAWSRIAVWALLTVALVVATRPLPWRQAIEQLRGVQVVWVAAAIVSSLAVLPLWAVEWRLLARNARVPFRVMFEVVAVTAAVLNSVPFFAGEAAGVAMLVLRARLTRSAAVSVLAMDQLLVGCAKIAVLAAAALYAPLPGWVRGGLTTLLIAVLGLALVLVVLAHRGEQLRERLAGRGGGPGRLLARAAGIGVHLESLKSPSLGLRLLGLALLKKGCELAAIVAVQLAFGLPPSLPIALLTLAALSVTTLLPVTPGNLGVYEATVFAVYRYAGMPAETALGIAIVQHLCVLLPALGAGYVTLALRPAGARRASTA